MLCTGLSNRHCASIRTALVRAAKDSCVPGLSSGAIAGKNQKDSTDWEVVDLSSIIVHIMTESARQYYDLEKLWLGLETENSFVYTIGGD